MINDKRKVIFVCTGNTCRSPMAEALLKLKLINDGNDNVEVQSRGIAAVDGQSAAKNAVAVMQDFGCDISSHKALNLSDEELVTTDKFICMTESHSAVLMSLGIPKQKIDVLNVSDPFGGGLSVYRESALEIKRKIDDLYVHFKL